jgi:hypothetical protein
MNETKESPAVARLKAFLERTKTDYSLFIVRGSPVRYVDAAGLARPIDEGSSFAAVTLASVKMKEVYVMPAGKFAYLYNSRGYRLKRHLWRTGFVHADSILPSKKEDDAAEENGLIAEALAKSGRVYLRAAEIFESLRPEGGFEHKVDVAAAMKKAIEAATAEVGKPDVPKGTTYNFHVEHAGEPGAGINPYNDTVWIEVESGEPGGTFGEFKEHVRQSLADWFDGAVVEPLEDFRERVQKEPAPDVEG